MNPQRILQLRVQGSGERAAGGQVDGEEAFAVAGGETGDLLGGGEGRWGGVLQGGAQGVT